MPAAEGHYITPPNSTRHSHHEKKNPLGSPKRSHSSINHAPQSPKEKFKLHTQCTTRTQTHSASKTECAQPSPMHLKLRTRNSKIAPTARRKKTNPTARRTKPLLHTLRHQLESLNPPSPPWQSNSANHRNITRPCERWNTETSEPE